jgi:hypothetical protein
LPRALSQRGTILFHGAEPGLIDELVEALCRRGDACADGLKLDLIFAVVSRYSKLMPVDWAAWRIAPMISGAALEAAGLTVMVLRPCKALGS